MSFFKQTRDFYTHKRLKTTGQVLKMLFTSLIIALIMLWLIIALSACAPRSATMCLSENGFWVKCPKNLPAGFIIKKAKNEKFH